MSKVTNTQKKVVKEKKTLKNEINNKNHKKKKKAKKLHFIWKLKPPKFIKQPYKIKRKNTQQRNSFCKHYKKWKPPMK